MVPNLVKIYYLSDFTIQVELPESYESGDFRYTIYTCGDIINGWEASYVDDRNKNCTIDGRIVTIYVDTPNALKPGCVTIQSEFPEKNYHFEDNVENIKSNYKTNIYLVSYRTNSFSAMWKPSLTPDLSGDSDVVKEDQLEYELGYYVTKEELSNASYTTYATMEQYVAEHAAEEVDLTQYALKTDLNAYMTEAELSAAGYVQASNLKTINGYGLVGTGNISITVESGAVDLSEYVTKQELSNATYVTKQELDNAGYLTSVPSDYITEQELSSMSYITTQEANSTFAKEADMSNVVTKQELSAAGYLTSVPSNYVTDSELASSLNDYAQVTDLLDYVTDSQLVTTLSSYATKVYVEDRINQIQPTDTSGLVSKQELSQMGYITAIPSEYVTDTELQSALEPYVTQTELSANGYVTQYQLNQAGYLTVVPSNYVQDTQLQQTLTAYATKEYVDDKVADIPQADLSDYVTKEDINAAGYLTAVPSNYATKEYVDDKVADIPQADLSEYVTKQELSGASYVTSNELSQAGYITSIPDNYITSSALESSLEGYVTKEEINAAGYLTAVPSNYATKTYVADYVAQNAPNVDLSAYVTKSQLTEASYVSKAELNAAGYLTAVPSNYATKDYVDEWGTEIESDILGPAAIEEITQQMLSSAGYITSIPSEYVTDTELQSALESYVTQTELSANGYLTSIPSNYATKTYVADYVATHASSADMSSYVTKSQLTEASYVTKVELSNAGYVSQTQLMQASYATVTYVNQHDETVVNNLINYVDTNAVTTEGLEQILENASYTSVVEISQVDYDLLPVNEKNNGSLYVITDYEGASLDNYATKSYVANYVATHASSVDLSSYVSKSELSQMGYITSIPSEYVTETELNAAGYITSVDLPTMPTIDESIIPNTTNTYTLGDSSHLYSATYVSNIKFTGDGRSSISATNSTTLRLAPDDVGFYFEKNGFRPGTNGNKLLGTSSTQWGYTYSANFIENGTNIKDIYASKTELNAAGYLTSANFQYDSLTNTLTITV